MASHLAMDPISKKSYLEIVCGLRIQIRRDFDEQVTEYSSATLGPNAKDKNLRARFLFWKRGNYATLFLNCGVDIRAIAIIIKFLLVRIKSSLVSDSTRSLRKISTS